MWDLGISVSPFIRVSSVVNKDGQKIDSRHKNALKKVKKGIDIYDGLKKIIILERKNVI
jgi:hypothetical protein